MRNLFLAILLAASPAFATERQLMNPENNGDLVLKANVAGTPTSALKITGTNNSVELPGSQTTGTLNFTGTTNAIISAKEGMTFNIDSDNNETDRVFKFSNNVNDGTGSVLAAINETGQLSVAGGYTDLPNTNSTSTGTVNDLAWTSGVIHFTNGSLSTLTGIVAQPEGTRVVIYNDQGAQTLTLQNNGGSTTTNRFNMRYTSDVVLAAGAMIEFEYLGSRWRPIGDEPSAITTGGVWTPTIICASGSVTMTTTVGRYTKMNNMVLAYAYLFFDKNTCSGLVTGGGLPFTVLNTSPASETPAAVASLFKITPAATGYQFTAMSDSNATTMSFQWARTGNVNPVGLNATDLASTGNGIAYTIMYISN